MAAHPVVLVLGPSLSAVSGVSTHVRLLLESPLHGAYKLIHHQVGSEGRTESWAGRGLRVLAGPFSLAAAVVRHEAAIVHINWSLDQKSYWRDLGHMLAAKLCGARVVFQKHGGQLAQFTRNPGFRALVRASFRLADTIVVLSQAELREYRAFVPGKNVACVPNGVDPVSVIVAPRPRGAATGGPLQVLYLGRLAAHKGIYETLEAVRLVRARGVKMRLVVAGSGPEASRLRDQAEALGLAADVRFAGPVHGEAKARLLCESDLLVLASYTEGLPYSLLEGMTAGLVPVVTAVGAIPEVMSDGIHGRIVPMKDPAAIADAFEWLDENRTALARMREACKRRVASAFTAERLAGEFNRVYAKLVPFVDATVRWRQV